MKEMSTLNVNGQSYKIKDAEAIAFAPQELLPQQQEQARANIGAMAAMETVKEKMVVIELASGGIASASGDEEKKTTRLRSDYIDITDVVKVETIDSNYPIYGHFYNDRQEHIDNGNTGGWVESFATADIIKKFSTVRYFRIVVKDGNNDKATLDPNTHAVGVCKYTSRTTSIASEFLLYTPQELTPAQQARARANIGVADKAVCVSCEQPSDPKAQIWYNPNGDVGTVEEKEEVNAPSVVAGIVGLALSEMLNNTAARYATIANALAGESATADGKVLAYSCGGKFNIMLLDDIASADTIAITKDCTLHLNGKTLSFTKAGACLTINTASEVTINGMVANSTIVKSGVTSSDNESLLKIENTHLVMLGGTYSITDITAKAILAIRANASTKIDMNGCAVIIDAPCGIRCTQFSGVSTINNCQFMATSQGTECTGIWASGTLTVTNSTIAVEGADTAYGIYAKTGGAIVTNCYINVSSQSATTALGVYIDDEVNEQVAIENCTIYALSYAQRALISGVVAACSNIIVTNCHIEADGYGDTLNEEGVVAAYGVYAIYANQNTTIAINGGYYLGRREALSITGTARINGGLFNGCQHGGAYMSGSDIKVKNAIFRNVPYNGVAMGSDSPAPYGALYCGGSAETNVYLDNCRIETVHHTWYGLVAKSNYTNVYLSNCVLDIIDSSNGELRADAKDTIYIGKNVSFDPTKVQLNNGTLDTITYADQEFGFETETTTSNALLSVKDERGNWVGIV